MNKIISMFPIIPVIGMFLLSACGNVDEGTVYTKDDIYINSYECGCRDEYERIRYRTVVIETEEQLAFAEKCFSLSEELEELKENYSLEEYNYVLDYDETSNGGYDIKADRLKITSDQIYFVMSEDSVYPGEHDIVTCAMGGFFHTAAVPKEYCEGKTFVNAIYPDASDITQYKEYEMYMVYDLADEALYNVYGSNQYIIRTEEEYNAFLAMAEGVELYEGKSLDSLYTNFDEAALLIIFFTRDETNIFCDPEIVQINENTISLNYELYQDESGYHMDTSTCKIQAYVPQELLTEEEYVGWIVPQ